jgi:hypothetical protein
MFVLKPDLICFRGLATCATELDGLLIHPPLIGRRIFDIFGCVHLPVKFQLLHEPVIGLTDRSCLPHVRKSFGRTDMMLVHQVCNRDGGGPRLSHCTGKESEGSSILSRMCWWQMSVTFKKVLSGRGKEQNMQGGRDAGHVDGGKTDVQ